MGSRRLRIVIPILPSLRFLPLFLHLFLLSLHFLILSLHFLLLSLRFLLFLRFRLHFLPPIHPLFLLLHLSHLSLNFFFNLPLTNHLVQLICSNSLSPFLPFPLLFSLLHLHPYLRYQASENHHLHIHIPYASASDHIWNLASFSSCHF